jgi:predicted methyltransferase
MTSNRYYFHAEQARGILAAQARGELSIDLSVDLNLSGGRFAFQGGDLILDERNRLSTDQLRWIAGKEDRIFCLEDGELEILETRQEGYCKLVPTDLAPLLEISGVKMHISKGTSPFVSAGQMAAQVVRRGDRVLDTCSGLGYAASAALELGAREVVSVEKSRSVIALRQKNPWSRRLFDPEVQRVHADIGDYIRQLPTASFDAVIHDPPRFSLAGELYGENFYRELHRVLKRRGALFHYTGNPFQAKRGAGFVEQVTGRLKAAGFSRVEKVAVLMGVTAFK